MFMNQLSLKSRFVRQDFLIVIPGMLYHNMVEYIPVSQAALKEDCMLRTIHLIVALGKSSYPQAYMMPVNIVEIIDTDTASNITSN